MTRQTKGDNSNRPCVVSIVHPLALATANCAFVHAWLDILITANLRYIVMAKYCGYLVRDKWLFQRGVELGHPRSVTVEDKMDMVLVASTDVMIKTNVYRYTKFRRVKTSKGTGFWCIAFAANDPISESSRSIQNDLPHTVLNPSNPRVVGYWDMQLLAVISDMIMSSSEARPSEFRTGPQITTNQPEA
ncbi:hypothetical protein BDR05DRAFT_949167 [Suillus weaverae]|nr:hypothetical protein BDR05DRAFT_949167 [Suillus weaverae]